MQSWEENSVVIQNNCSVEILYRPDEIHLKIIISSLENQRGIILNNEGATGAWGLIDPRPVEHGRGSSSGASLEHSHQKWGSRGLAPLGCLPPL